jgi:hypothetical protein
MNQKLCLLICFFVGVLVYYLLKNTCGCGTVVEGLDACTGSLTGETLVTSRGEPANANYRCRAHDPAKDNGECPDYHAYNTPTDTHHKCIHGTGVFNSGLCLSHLEECSLGCCSA